MKYTIPDVVAARLYIQFIIKPQEPGIGELSLLRELHQSDLTPIGRLNRNGAKESLQNLAYKKHDPLCFRDSHHVYTLRHPDSAMSNPDVRRAMFTLFLQKPLAELNQLGAVEFGFCDEEPLSTRNAMVARGKGEVKVVSYEVPPLVDNDLYPLLRNGKAALAARFG